MKPFKHAKNSKKKWGGVDEDYQKIHDWFDQTKMCIPDMRHRMVLHNAFGIFLAEQIFGTTITNSDGTKVSVRDIGEQHVIEDLGHIPTLEKCFKSMELSSWMGGRFKASSFKIID